jgi:hypothetical protein
MYYKRKRCEEAGNNGYGYLELCNLLIIGSDYRIAWRWFMRRCI